MTQIETRARLAGQLSSARRSRRWRLSDLSQRTGRNSGRLSEMENGKANSTVDSLSDAGDALGLTLMFIPNDKLEQVLALIDRQTAPPPAAYDVPSMFDELFIRGPDPDGEEGDHAHAHP